MGDLIHSYFAEHDYPHALIIMTRSPSDRDEAYAFSNDILVGFPSDDYIRTIGSQSFIVETINLTLLSALKLAMVGRYGMTYKDVREPDLQH